MRNVPMNCPHCTGEAYVLVHSGILKSTYSVLCAECDASSGIKDTRTIAVVAWNRRAPSTTAAAALQEARDALITQKRMTTDQTYMLAAYRNMLGENGLKVAQLWKDSNILRVHFSWGPDAEALTGEERAKFILELKNFPKTDVHNFDGDEPATIQKEPK